MLHMVSIMYLASNVEILNIEFSSWDEKSLKCIDQRLVQARIWAQTECFTFSSKNLGNYTLIQIK